MMIMMVTMIMMEMLIIIIADIARHLPHEVECFTITLAIQQ